MSTGGPVSTTVVEVAHGRLARWLDNVAGRHGGLVVTGAEVRAADGFVAVVTPWQPLAEDVADVATLVARCAPPSSIGLVLLRRGGYAVARDVDGEAVDRKVGRRHVQSRTAAGGWSQQRFARRRGKQADELVTAVTDHVARLLLPHVPDALVVGGDRTLVGELLQDRRLLSLTRLPRRELWDLPDPTPPVLERARARARSVRISLEEPERSQEAPSAGP